MLRRTLLALTGCLLASVALADPAPKNWDGLEQVHSSQLDEVYLLRGADFSGYRAILLEPIEVAFRRNWLRDLNHTRGVERMSAAEMDKLGADLGALFREAFVKELTRRGWRFVEAPGDDVLRVQARLMDLNVYAPDVPAETGRTRKYAMEAGEARLVVEMADSATRELLGRSVDRRRTGDKGILEWANDVITRQEFERMFERWSEVLARDLDHVVKGEIKAAPR